MGVINPYEQNIFKSSRFIFAKVRRDLKSYDAAGLIDAGEFPQYVRDVLRKMGISVFKEQESVVKVRDYIAPLPADFSVLYSAHKCTSTFNQKDRVHQQGDAVSVYQDVTWELLTAGNGCEIVCDRDNKILERIEVRQFVKEETICHSLTNPVLLRLSPNVKKNKCTSDCENLFATSPLEITITDDREIITNFANDAIYLKYYGLPVDEEGVPMIPDIELVERAIEWYIKYQVLMGLWMNNQVPDLQNRWQFAKGEYERAIAEARWERKVPSFARMVNQIRRKRSSSQIFVYAQLDKSGYWQKM